MGGAGVTRRDVLVDLRRRSAHASGQVWQQFANLIAIHTAFLYFPENELFQLLTQRFICAKQQRLSGGLAQLQHARNLAVIHLLILVHDDSNALALRQCVYHAADGGPAAPVSISALQR